MSRVERAWEPAAEPVVVATAVVNGLGFSPHQVWAMRRAEQTALVESPFVLPDGTRATMGLVRTLPPRSHGEARMTAMAARLVDEVLPVLSELRGGESRVAVWLCLPERMRPGDAEVLRLGRRVGDVLSAIGTTAEVHATCDGHAATARALVEAGNALASRRLEVALLLAVDSYHDPRAIERLIEEERVFDGENLDGTVPGEGGALLALARRDVAHSVGWRTLASVRASAVAEEMASFGTEMACSARGMTEAASFVTQPLRHSGAKLDWWLADTTGEEHRQHEMGLTVPRIADGIAAPALAVESLPTHFGDLGSACMATAMVLAVEAFRRGGPSISNCLVTGASDGRSRGAVLLEAGTSSQ